MKRLGGTIATVLAMVLCAACAPVTVFDALVPTDAGAREVRGGIAYGDHPRQKLDVYAPVDRSGAEPVVVVFYGGSWNSGRRQDYRFLGKAIASRGFVTVVADYRLVPEVLFPVFLEDSARAVKWVHGNAAQFGGDPQRLFLLGHSAGAYNAVMVGLDPRYLRSIGSSPAIVKGVIGLAGPYDFLPLDVASTKAAFSNAPNLRLTQPINFASADAPAMFLATGDVDTTVRPRNTLTLAKLLGGASPRVTLKRYPDLGHIGILLALSQPFRSKAPVLDDVTRFIEHHSKPRPGKS